MHVTIGVSAHACCHLSDSLCMLLSACSLCLTVHACFCPTFPASALQQPPAHSLNGRLKQPTALRPFVLIAACARVRACMHLTFGLKVIPFPLQHRSSRLLIGLKDRLKQATALGPCIFDDPVQLACHRALQNAPHPLQTHLQPQHSFNERNVLSLC